MDANQTRFHLLLTKAEWLGESDASLPASPTGLEWDESDQALHLESVRFLFPDRPSENPPTLAQRRGMATDKDGAWYWISDDDRSIQFLGTPRAPVEQYWPAKESCGTPDAAGFHVAAPVAAPAPRLAGLTVTGDHYLVAGTESPAGLLVFDLYSGGPPMQLLWPADVPFAPFDMEHTADGGLVILDRQQRRYWTLDRQFRVRGPAIPATPLAAPAFEPLGAAGAPVAECEPREATAVLATPLAFAADPIAIDRTPDGVLAILDMVPAGTVIHFVCDGVLIATVPTVRALDIAIAASDPPVLFVVAPSGNQAFAYRVNLGGSTVTLAALPSYYPMRQFSGKGIVADGSQVYYDLGGNSVAVLAEQPRKRYVESGSLTLPPGDGAFFDGQQPACVWHRLFVDGNTPPGTQVDVESRATDEARLLADSPWEAEPQFYLRGSGSEVPFYRTAVPGTRSGTWELLFQNARGRYLQLRLTLRGTGRATPRIGKLRAYYPRFSYTRAYLPAVYRDDPTSASFLDRYLANVEGMFTAIEDKIQAVEGFFDARVVPAEYLEWLASWMNLTLDAGWNEAARRLVIRHAMQLYRERGTRAGMTRALRLALESCADETLFDQTAGESRFSARVVENHLRKRAPGVLFGDPTDVSGPGSTTEGLDWKPEDGPGILHDRFRDYLASVYRTIGDVNTAWSTSYTAFSDNALRLPGRPPVEEAKAIDWRRSLASALGFTYEVPASADLGLWKEFLERRYRQPGDLNAAYKLQGEAALASFAEVDAKLWEPLRESIPAANPALRDWIQFVSGVLPTRRHAQRFTVLIPVRLDDPPAEQVRKREIGRRVAEIAKPAGTQFDVRLFWAMFRVGEARLGLDTLLGPGSRATAQLLGQKYVGTGFLPHPAAAAAGRVIVGEPPREGTW